MKKYIIGLSLCLTLLSLGSCSDFLVPRNPSAGQDADEFFASPEGLAALKAKAYRDLRPLVTTTDFNEWGTDIYTVGKTTDPGEFHRFSSLNAENSVLKSFYTNAYTLINDANGVLYYGGEQGVNADEAKFLRNYGYYLLTQQFGGVPYITRYINSANREYPRESVEVIYTSMMEELESVYANGLLPDNSLGANTGVASLRSVAALLSKVYLAAGWDLHTTLSDASAGTYQVTKTDYFEKACQWAETAINGQALSLEFADKWSPYNENNEEEIFSVQWERAGYTGDILTGGHGLQNAYGHSYGDQTNGMKSCGARLVPTAKAAYLWEKGDTRWEGTFMPILYNAKKDEQGVHWGTEGYYAAYNAPADTATMNIVLAYFPCYANHTAVKNWVSANKSRFVGTGYANKTARVFVMSDPMLILNLKEDGSIGQTQTFGYIAGSKESNAGVTCRKYDDPDTQQAASSSQSYRDVLVFHLSETYLTAAEAYLMAGKTDKALACVNAVRARAHAATLTSFDAYVNRYSTTTEFGDITALDVILDERARELFGENEGRWVDLRRTKQMVRYNLAYNEYTSLDEMTGQDGCIKWLRPIPAAEIGSNDGISLEQQNPGY